jgi:hypothetical protein
MNFASWSAFPGCKTPHADVAAPDEKPEVSKMAQPIYFRSARSILLGASLRNYRFSLTFKRLAADL